MKSSNLAIVFVDIAGFTERTSQQSRGESEAWLRRYEELLLPLVKAFGGNKVKAIGDAYLLTFISPTNALLFGMAAQDRLYDYNRSAPEDKRIEIRVACNVGEVRQCRGDVLGEPVNIAARLEGITPTGAIWFTEAVYLAMTKSEVPSEEIGEQALKGIKEPVRIHNIPKGQDYRLLGQGELAQDDQAQTTVSEPAVLQYPYGGIGLKRAEERGWAMSLASVKSKLTFAGGRTVSFISGLTVRFRVIPGKVWIGLAIVTWLVFMIVLWMPDDRYSAVEKAIEQSNPERALSLLDNHPEGDKLNGLILRAQALLMQNEIDQAEDILQDVIEKNVYLLNDDQVIRALVTCLNHQDAQKTMALIKEKLANSAVSILIEASRDKRYWLRWHSIQLLEQFGELDEVDLAFAYIQDLRFGNSCSTRKRAAKKLAELKEQRALEYLSKAKERGFFKNLCMGDTLDEAIKTIEKEK